MHADAYLAWYARSFRSVEINNTFYHLPTHATLVTWRDHTPADFVFACKASRYITHMKKLKDPSITTPRFFDAVSALGDKLGPILFQLPPRWRVDTARLQSFLEALPEGFRYAFEFRDESWFTPGVYAVLERHGAALCTYDLLGRRSPIRMTAHFVYVRLHGPKIAYGGSYDGRTLYGWARRMRAWCAAGLDVYCYFNNDQEGHAVKNALMLAGMAAGH